MPETRGLLIIGGDAPEDAPRFEDPESRWVIVAADSGLYHAERYALRPDIIVGDFDSLDTDWVSRYFGTVPREEYDRAKDYTDTEIGLRYLWKRGITEVTMVGGGGGRLDHLLGLRSLFDRDQTPIRWITDHADVILIDNVVEFESQKGETVSFFPAGPDTCRMRTRGLRWELDKLEWGRGDAGISNEFVGDLCRVEILNGRLLMVRELTQAPSLPGIVM